MGARGALTGGLVGVGFGLVFVLVNSAGLGPWTVALRVAAVVAAAAITADLFRRLGPASRADDGTGAAPRWGAGYRLIVAAEAVALFGGVQVIVRALDAPRYAIAWVAFVVGVHFFGLAVLWRVARFHVLGAVMVLLAGLAVLAGLLGAPDAAVRLLAGVGSGTTLLVFAATAGRPAPTAPGPGRLRRRRKIVAEVQARAINEKVDELLDESGADARADARFFCECSNPSCSTRIELTPERWEAVHEDRRAFVIAPAHVDHEVDRVVDSLPGYLVVRKVAV